jgi:hypothetical protein
MSTLRSRVLPVLKSFTGWPSALVFLLLIGGLASCQKAPPPREYSADFAMTDSTSSTSRAWGRPDAYRAKIYVTPEKVRIDFERSQPTKIRMTVPGEGEVEKEIPASFKGPYWGSGKYVIMNYSDQSGWVINPTDNSYSAFLDEPDARERLILTVVLFSLQPAAQHGSDISPCPKNAESPCKRIGAEQINGREAVKWQTSWVRRSTYMAETVQRSLWVDRDLGVLLKSSDLESGSSLTNLKQNKQDAALFQIPAGYNKK